MNTRDQVENKSAASVSLPRALEVKVAEAKYRTVLDKCTARGQFLAGCNPQFLSALLVKLKVVFLMLGEEIVKKVRQAAPACTQDHVHACIKYVRQRASCHDVSSDLAQISCLHARLCAEHV